MSSLSHPFVVLKLKTGDTLFGEILEHRDYVYVIRHPRITRSFPMNDSGKEGLVLDKWVPYTDDEIFEINDEVVYYIGELSESYVKFYGSCLLREELAKIQREGNDRIADGEFGFSVVKEIMAQIRELGEDYSIKYGISPTSHMVSEEDLSDDRTLN